MVRYLVSALYWNNNRLMNDKNFLMHSQVLSFMSPSDRGLNNIEAIYNFI